METIQVVLDTKLLQATGRAAHRTKRNRSALIRDALREHLRRLEIRALEQRDRDGYANGPRMRDEALVWEAEAAWPAESPEGTSVSPETSPQLIDSSSQHRSVAFQAAMPPFLGAFFRVAHPLPPRSSSVALNSALSSASQRLSGEGLFTS